MAKVKAATSNLEYLCLYFFVLMAKLPPVSSRGYCISPELSSAQLSPAQSCTKIKPHPSWRDNIQHWQGCTNTQTGNAEPGVESSQGRGEDGTSSAITYPRGDIPGRYSCGLISHSSLIKQHLRQSMWHQHGRAWPASTRLLGHTASPNIAFALG